ncbi:hypothetical protein [Acinetobacter sp. ANC 4862]|uniref:hypothetical protein n=1 Tax=Acinetobacter sp. ANC 4862 TaxID=2529849 RepID=UPI001039F02B|nr:hypothetical protein [Acinetobacter sp. ANC 4862]TCH64848.1 hypothetical protein E0409_03685 [Acinetobacter sp. ANC 4862]
MKALIISDEINQFHGAMLKSVLLILSLLPMSQGILALSNATEGSSQIMVGFFAISLFSALFVLCFWSALKVTVLRLQQEQISSLEQSVVKVYRYIPMLFLTAMMSYLVTRF